jgi:uncharacterized repeat protein (TIGR01451 family)
VKDVFGNAVVNTFVTFTTTGGSLAQLSGSTNATGIISITLTSSVISQTVTVTATSINGKVDSTQVQFLNVDNPATVLTGTYTVNTNTVKLGDVLTFTFVLTNNGQSQNDGIVMSATIPDFTHLTGTVHGGTHVLGSLLAMQSNAPAVANKSSGYVFFTGSLLPGESHKIVFAVVVDQIVFPPNVIRSTATGILKTQLDFSTPVTVVMPPKTRLYMPVVQRNI